MAITIRRLTGDDLDVADTILVAAYNSMQSRRHILGRNLAMQPDGWMLASLDGAPVGVGGAMIYGPYAYIGMIGVHPSAQRRGVACAIMERIMCWLDDRGCRVAVLDASDAGAALYEKLSFVVDDTVETFDLSSVVGLVPPASRIAPVDLADLDELAAFDATISRGDRRAGLEYYLTTYPGRGFAARDDGGAITGYMVAQDWALGPWLACEPVYAEALLAAALTLPFTQPPRVIVPGANMAARELVQRYGFERNYALRHMRHGGSGPPMDRIRIYGQGSFASG